MPPASRIPLAWSCNHANVYTTTTQDVTYSIRKFYGRFIVTWSSENSNGRKDGLITLEQAKQFVVNKTAK